MLIVTFVFCLVVLIAFQAGNKKSEKGLLTAFSVLLFFFALRGHYGNDYQNYLDIFNQINGYGRTGQNLGRYEFGWLIVNKILGPIGFHAVLFAHLILLLYPFYLLIQRYVPSKLWWLSVFLICFNPSVFLLSLSMLRQSAAQSLILLSVDAILLSKRMRSICFAGSALLFHYSSAVFFPFVFLKDLFKKIKPALLLVIIAVVLYVLSTNDAVVEYLLVSITTNEQVMEEYGNYAMIESEGGSGYGVLLQYLFLLPALFCIKKLDESDYLLIFLYLVGFLFVPFGKFMVLFLRLSGYFTIFSIFLLPRLISKCSIKIVNIVTYLMMFVYFLYSYYQFFYSATYGRYFMNYTLFFFE